jgi:hypothetical protein
MQDISNRVAQPQPDTSTAVALLQLQQQQNQQQIPNGNMLSPSSFQSSDFQPAGGGRAVEMESPVSLHSHVSGQSAQQSFPFPTNGVNGGYATRPIMDSMSGSGTKRKRGDFEVRNEPPADVVSKGLISYDDAALYFGTFFRGCVSPVSGSGWGKGKEAEGGRINTCLFSTRNLILSSR